MLRPLAATAPPGVAGFSPRVVGCLPHGYGCSSPGAPLRARSAAPKDVARWPVLSLTPQRSDALRLPSICRPAAGKPMTLNKGVGKDGSQTQRAAAMAAFQTQGKDV
jgi:hypothetical protein